jgi:predicted transposase YbfD/YdcC
MNEKLSTAIEKVQDPRVKGRCKHKLFDILSIILCAMCANADTFEEIEDFGLEYFEELKEFLELSNGIPRHDTFNRVLQLIAPDVLMTLLLETQDLIKEERQERQGMQLCLDGKKLKGASPKSKGTNGHFLLNAYLVEDKMCIAQKKIEDKSNEITAIPKLLENIDIKGLVVSTDALNCQTEIAKLVAEKKGEYLLSVKGNQRKLHEEMKEIFKNVNEEEKAESSNDGHGRNEKRECWTVSAKKHLSEEQLKRWSNIETLVMVKATREIKDKKTESVRYYISSEKGKKSEYYNQLVRERWSIENKLHWHLDVTFGEDMCRSRTKNVMENLSILRKFVLKCLQQKKEKLSMKRMRFKANMNFSYMIHLLFL